MNSLAPALPRAGDIQNSNPVCDEPVAHYRRGSGGQEVQHQAGVAIGSCQFDRGCRPSGWFATGQDQRSVSVTHVPGALLVIRPGRLLESIGGGYGAVFGLSSFRAPAAVRDSERNGDIRGSAIDTRLAT